MSLMRFISDMSYEMLYIVISLVAVIVNLFEDGGYIATYVTTVQFTHMCKHTFYTPLNSNVVYMCR